MSTAIVPVQNRHVAFPECCLFAPTELQIGSQATAEEYTRIGKVISSVDGAADLWECDYALWGMKRFGEAEGLKLAASATNLSGFFLKRCARIADVFPPARRVACLNRSHYRILLPFTSTDFLADQAQLDAWLQTVATPRLSAASLRALAAEKFGEPDTAKRRNKMHSLQISEILWARLAEIAPSRKAVCLIEFILEGWLARTEEHAALLEKVAAAAQERKNARERQKRDAAAKRKAERERIEAQKAAERQAVRAWKEKERAEKAAAKAAERAAQREQEEREERAEAEAQEQRERDKAVRLAALGSRCSAGNEKNHAVSLQPEGATRFGKKFKMDARVQISFYGSCHEHVSAYRSLADANLAAEKYSIEKGYTCEGFLCEKCKTFHVRAKEKLQKGGVVLVRC